MNSRADLGRWGERQARLHLEAEGYGIAATNFRCRAGEIDIVAIDGDELVFVEVKTRRGDSFGTAEESISPIRAERLVVVAEEFLQSRQRLPLRLRNGLADRPGLLEPGPRWEATGRQPYQARCGILGFLPPTRRRNDAHPAAD